MINLQKCELFNGFSNAEVEEILKLSSYTEYKYPKGTYFDNKEGYIYIILDGQINITKSINDRSIVLDTFYTNDSFGETMVFSGKYNKVHLEFKSDSHIIMLNISLVFKEGITINNLLLKLYKNVVSNLSNKNISLLNRINCMTQTTITKKIDYYKKHVNIPMTHEKLANYLGVNRSALSRVISKKNI